MAQKMVKRKSATKSKVAPSKGLAAKLALVEKPFQKRDFPTFKGGDTIKVHVRIKEGDKERIQIFEGVVIKRGNHGSGKSFMVRKMSHGVGVERVFVEASPKIAKIEVVQVGKVRRAKLYYLRNLEGKKARITKDIRATEAASNS